MIYQSDIYHAQTKLVIFFNTPYQRSIYTGWGEIASNLTILILQDLNKKIIKILKMNSEILDNIHKEFKTITDQSQIRIHLFQKAYGISDIKGLHNKVHYQHILNILLNINYKFMTNCRQF